MSDENPENFYIDRLMKEWGMCERSHRIQACVRRVLRELSGEALLALIKNPKLEVKVIPKPDFSIWAYFPIHRNRLIARRFAPTRTTRVLVVLSEPRIEEQPLKVSEDELRDHLGHTLLYLRSPKARNECSDAQREWQDSARVR